MADNRFGKYELLGRLAVGGMAEIFKARYSAAAGVSKAVVIKRILPHYAENKKFISMFTDEARIVMGLSHGNIAQVFDFGEIDGDWFIAMEYVDGQPLSTIIKRARQAGIEAIPPALAVLISIEVLKGLHYAHTRLDERGQPLKIVHRDVSPQNVLVSYEGQVKLVDFGIAKARTEGREVTETGQVKGKYSYFSPEQARGRELDHRTDVFSAGIVLYEMLCGRLPFQGRMVDVMSRIVRGQFSPPRQLNPDISDELEAIILIAMAHERDRRYATADAFAQALSTYLNQKAPDFRASALGNFVQFLFETDLVSESRPIELKAEFLDQVVGWKKALPSRPLEPLEQLEIADDKVSTRPEAPLGGDTGAVTGRSPASRRAFLWVAIPLGAAVAAAAGAYLYPSTGTFSVELTSSPSFASVRVDRVLQQKKTPVALKLDASKPHEIEVSSPGRRDWSQFISKQRGEAIAFHAALEAEDFVEPRSAAEDPAPEPEAPDEAKPLKPAEVAPLQALYPQLRFKLFPSAHAFRVADTPAARLKLDPALSYKVWAEGRASLGGPSSAKVAVSECGYFVEGGPARDSFGQLGLRPITLKGASTLYVFFLDVLATDNTGGLKVKVKDAHGHVETLAVDAKVNVVTLEPSQRMTYVGTDSLTSFSLKLGDGSELPRTRGIAGGALSRVMAVQHTDFGASDTPAYPYEGLQIIELGKSHKLHGTGLVWLTFPDDDLSDNDGSIDVEVIPGPRRPKN